MQREKGAARGSGASPGEGAQVSPCSPGQDGGQGHRQVTLTAGVRFPKALTGVHLQRAQRPAQEGFRKTWPSGCKPYGPECFRTIHTATYILSPTHTAAYIISTAAKREIHINDPLSFFLLKAAGYRNWQPGSWWYSSHSRSKWDASGPHTVPSPGLCPVADQGHFYSSLKRDKSNL